MTFGVDSWCQHFIFQKHFFGYWYLMSIFGIDTGVDTSYPINTSLATDIWCRYLVSTLQFSKVFLWLLILGVDTGVDTSYPKNASFAIDIWCRYFIFQKYFFGYWYLVSIPGVNTYSQIQVFDLYVLHFFPEHVSSFFLVVKALIDSRSLGWLLFGYVWSSISPIHWDSICLRLLSIYPIQHQVFMCRYLVNKCRHFLPRKFLPDWPNKFWIVDP